MSVKIVPVIHFISIDQAVENARIASKCGCQSVAVISMDGQNELLAGAISAIKAAFPELHVGVNYLGMSAPKALLRSINESADFTWSDSAGVTSEAISNDALQIEQILAVHSDHRLFAGVAFNYQAHEPRPGAAAIIAAELGMIPTTSGTATGVAIDLPKLQSMRLSLNTAGADTRKDYQLALASGVSPEYIGDVAPYVDYVFVSTHITSETKKEHFCEEKLQRLVQGARV